jgi:hypothetical protein
MGKEKDEYKEIDVAKIESSDVGFDDHGRFSMFARFIYKKGKCSTGSQGIAYVIDGDFIKRFIRACGAGTLLDCNGRMVNVEHTKERINRIIPISKDREGDIFDIDKWREKDGKKHS